MARELAEHLLILAQRQADPVLLLSAHSTLGAVLFYHGEIAAAQGHLTEGTALYVPAYHRALVVHHGFDLGVFGRCFMALSLWLLGASDQALAHGHKAPTLAQELAHPFSLAFALTHLTRLHQWRRDILATLRWSEALIDLSLEHGFGQYMFHGRLLHGLALVMQGRADEGLGQMRHSLTAYEATGAVVWLPYYLALLVEGYRQVGAADEGLRVLSRAWATVQKTGERVWEAELHRLQGELLLQQTNSDALQAEACFHQALDVAHHQGAKSLELRAAMSLARLWQLQGKCTDAWALLAPLYGWFTEGFDTADLREAKALLEELVG